MINTASKRSVILWRKHDRWSPFQVYWFDDVHSKHLVDFRLFKLSCFPSFTLRCRFNDSDIRRGTFDVMLGDSDSEKASIPYMPLFLYNLKDVLLVSIIQLMKINLLSPLALESFRIDGLHVLVAIHSEFLRFSLLIIESCHWISWFLENLSIS